MIQENKIIEGLHDLTNHTMIIGNRMFYIDNAEAYHEANYVVLKAKLIRLKNNDTFKTKLNNDGQE